MLIEALTHLISLDIGWFISLFMSNLHYIFALTAVMYFFFGGKNVIKAMFFITIVLWTLGDLGGIANLAVFVGGFLTLMYLTKLGIIVLTEDSSMFKKYIVPISSIQAYLVLFIYNWFLV